MSSRHTRGFFGVMLAVVFALSAVIVAPASAKLTKHQKAHIRHQLMRQIKKNPKLIRSKSFIKKASLVNFTLPVTIKLRNSGNGTPQDLTSNPNSATIDLGASLGQREIGLGGSLGAEIQFHDSFDGGALGNVDLVIDPPGSNPKYLTSTSIPLLWNPNVSNGGVSTGLASIPNQWDTGLATGNATTGGCDNFLGSSNLPFDPNQLAPGTPVGGYPGVPEFTFSPPATFTPTGAFVPVSPGIDSIDALKAYNVPGNINYLGSNPFPFPASPGPGNDPNAPITSTPSVEDTVLRTAPLKLTVATPGTDVNQSTGSGPNGSQNIVIGKSGGQANLFGNIPGKPYGVDVTVSLATQINSIIRAVDSDAQHIVPGLPWPAALFNCRQAYTGSVPNYIPGVKLKGTLKISPAITPGGDLRIAKVSLSSLSEPVPTHIALAACLSPYSVLAAENGHNEDTVSYPVPASSPGVVPTADLPADTSTARTDFSDAGTCNSGVTKLVSDTGFNGLTNATTADGYSSFATSSDGSKVSVAGDITVNDVEADVLIGDR